MGKEHARGSEGLLRQRDGERRTEPFKQVIVWMSAIRRNMLGGRVIIGRNIQSMFKRIEFTGGNGNLSKVHRIAEMKIHK